MHLRTTNPIESTFATVCNRSKITKGHRSRAAGIAMAYKLIEAAQSRWRAKNAPHLVALVRAGARFENGKLVDRPDETITEEATWKFMIHKLLTIALRDPDGGAKPVEVLATDP